MSVGPTSSSSSSAASDAYTQNARRAQQLAEEEVDKKLSESHDLLRRIEQEEEANIKDLRDGFAKQYQRQNANYSNALENQKLEGSRIIHDLHQQQSNEYNKSQRAGERDSNQITQYYRNKLSSLENHKNRQLNEALSESNQMQEYEKRQNEDHLEHLRGQHELRVQQLTENSDEQLQSIQAQRKGQLDHLRMTASQEQMRQRAIFEGQLKETLDSYKESMGNLTEQIDQQLQQIKQGTSEKLAAYTSKQNDPFYHLINMDIQVKDEADAYFVTLNIPKYEQKSISTAMRGKDLVISGHRQSKENLTFSEGRTQGTAAYQTFYEKIPLPLPVDAKNISRQNQDHQLIIRIPKTPIS